MPIPRETVDAIFDAAKIEEVVSDYLSLRRRGANLWACCPFHGENTPSFSVNPPRNIFKCFGCGKAGSPVSFVMEIEQCSFPEALHILARKYHIEIKERELTAEEQQVHDDRESMFVVNEWANQWYQDQLWNTEEGRAVGLSYFHERGLNDETIKRFQLGYSPERANLLPKAAQEKGFEEKYLINNPDSAQQGRPQTSIGTGICGRSSGENGRPQRLYDRYHGRVIFPIHGISGKTVGLAGRILVKNDNVGKYVNSPDSIVYSKSRELYGIFLAKHSIVQKKKCYLVEGQMDVISMAQAGITNVVCSGGTALTKQQIALIHRFTEDVTLIYDGDAAGIRAALKGINLFLAQGINVKVLLLPDGHDPDSFSRVHTAEEFVKYISTHEEDFIRYKTRTLLADAGSDLHLHADAVRSIAQSISLLRDGILRDSYMTECAQQTGTPKEVIKKEVNKQISLRIEEQKRRQEAIEKGLPYTEKEGEQDPMPMPTKPAPKPVLDLLDMNCRNLIRALVRYGEQPLCFAAPDSSLYSPMVGDYMILYMQQCQIKLQNPLYELFFSEFDRHKSEPNFSAEKCFIRHENQYISQLATELLADSPVLCKSYAENGIDYDNLNQSQLTQHVVLLLQELYYEVIKGYLLQLDKQIQEADHYHDDQKVINLLTLQKQYTELSTSLATQLGHY